MRTFYMIAGGLCIAVLILSSVASADTDDWFPSTETIVFGFGSGGTFPVAIQTSNDVYRTFSEGNNATPNENIAPNVEQLIRGTSVGFTNLLNNDDANWVGTEGAIGGNIQNYAPGSETILKGTLSAGSFPSCVETSDDTRCTWQESDQAAAPTDLLADGETIVKGTNQGGVFPTDINTDNGAMITYREANQGITGTIAFDAAAESERTGTTDPHTWTHTPVGTPRAILVFTSHGVTATEHVLSCTYGGVSMTKSVTASDGAGEPGRSQIWFLGASIPTGAQTVSCDLDSATADDIHFVSISFTGSGDTEVTDTDIDQGDQANPSTTLAYGGRREIAAMVFYSGAVSPPATTACSGSSACTLSHTMDQGAFGDSVAYQTTAGTTDQVMGWTQGNDDVAVSYIAITEIATAVDYEIEVKYDWTTETCVTTRRLTVNGWHTNTENILVQVYDSNELNPVTQITITATADGTTYTYDLSTDEWDLGNPNIRFLGNNEVGDTIQTDLLVDYVVIRCILPLDYEVEIKHSWTGVSTTGTEWRLFVEGREGTNPETIDVRIYGSDETTLSAIVCSIISTTESEYDCGTLTTDQIDSGTPDINLRDNDQANDALQSTFDLDRVRIQRSFNRYEIDQVHQWITTITTADFYVLRTRAFRSDEDIFVQVWDWPGSSWTTRITVNVGTETLFSHTLVSTERASNGTVMTRWLGSSESSSDEIQSTVTADVEVIERSFNQDYEVHVRYSWSGINTTGTSWVLFVECKRGLNPEDGLLQVVDSTETTWTTRYTCNTNTDFTYSTYPLTADELDSGSPDMRLIGATETGDSSNSTWDLDVVKIVRTFAAPSTGQLKWVPFILSAMVSIAILAWGFSEREM